MISWWDRHKDEGLLVVRLGLGALFLTHGWPKLTGGPELWAKVGEAMARFGITWWPEGWGLAAALAEFGGGLCLMAGVFFRPALSFLIFTMAVASAHHLLKGDGLGRASHALEDMMMFIGLLFLGPGRYRLFASRKPEPPAPPLA